MERDHNKFVEFYNNYWIYYRQLEDELLTIRKYVDFSKQNLRTYSMEFLKLYQAVCSEIDVVGKVMALNVNKKFDSKNANIQRWWYVVRNYYQIIDGPLSGMNETNKETSYVIYEYSCGDFCGIHLVPWEKYNIECYKNQKGNTCYKLCEGSKTPEWWRNYNAVKHNRVSIFKNNDDSNFEKANLKNVVLAFSALYVLERSFLDTVGTNEDIITFTNHSELFTGRKQLTIAQVEFIYKHI